MGLYQRRRSPRSHELDCVPWLALLEPGQRQRAVAGLLAADAQRGEFLCHEGRAATFYFGVIEGLVRMTSCSPGGVLTTYAGIPSGGWFGEGTMLKGEPYRYDIEVLRPSVVAGLPMATFHWLLDQSLGFNRYVMRQLNERLAQFISAHEVERLGGVDRRVAYGLAALFNPVLYPGVGERLRITQYELAQLVGLARQTVNESLVRLAARGVLEANYGSVRVPDLAALLRAPQVAPKNSQASPGRPKTPEAPLGGSAVHEVTSVGANNHSQSTLPQNR